MSLLKKYFPFLSVHQLAQFKQLVHLYNFWNQKINLISRQDIDFLEEHHFLHSLAIAKFIQFEKDSLVLDVGTGGGFPGIPLAILFPEVKFHLVDLVEKKVRVVDIIYRNLALQNVRVDQADVRYLEGKYEFIVSRAVTDMVTLYHNTGHLISDRQRNAFPNGIISLKGGDFMDEMGHLAEKAYMFSLYDHFTEPYFKDKHLIYIPV